MRRRHYVDCGMFKEINGECTCDAGKDDISDIVSPDAETVTNEKGGKQSGVPVRFDLIDAKALFEQAKVLHEGAEKYGENNWRLIPVEDHLNHLIMHAYAYLAGDRTDEHLSHIMCRATFAQGVAITDEEHFPCDDEVCKQSIHLQEFTGFTTYQGIETGDNR